jgi:hypothetical protein
MRRKHLLLSGTGDLNIHVKATVTLVAVATTNNPVQEESF